MHKIDSNPAPKNWTLYYKDSLAYDGERGIYTITDNKTGKEFVGVSGVGIAELGSHSETHTDSNGKSQTTIVTDER
ncbi:TPA: hypothetical protein NUW79_003117 [Escherichia coli]|nr:hypothetical protein [Escherichia coli]HCJ8610280.1 hypothetical protein [Escherichia coli]